MSFALPGDQIQLQSATNVVVGPHVRLDGTSVTAATAGFLVNTQSQGSAVCYIEADSKRYVPSSQDFVVGTVVGSFGESYRVSLSNFSTPAVLGFYAFPNASKKNRPRLKTGDLVYARIASTDPDLDVELECFDATTGKEGGFGLLEGGFVFDVRLAYARHLLRHQDAPVLTKLMKKYQFELAIGANGRIWIKSDTLQNTIECMKAIQNGQNEKQT
ncbi:hypothetical protein OGAPHI_001051 [Ogataea philodendri]|uniref:K Homology domain-containing protein n=1 Tax=Ogataea philodendri TaxID=1378263 RepID=A0A9P8T9Y3_9ASCO|nr:uncharacterized protein OGAPHI_001051 [Ogataea philodendri]KAH3670536.1 hypothetical protein OGAPHI_001051 [Ogataea philodendri]